MNQRALWQPTSRQTWSLAGMLLLSAAPHLLRLPVSLSAIWLLAVGWRLSLLQQAHPLPPRLLRLLLTLVTGLGLYLHFGTVLGREAGSALLVMMAGLKLLELARRRDAFVVVLLSYLLVAVQFMFARSPGAALYACVTTLVTTSIWIGLSCPPDTRAWRSDLALGGVLLIQSVPLMLFLFVLFPRLPGPLWSLPSDAHAHSGLSGEMEPGRISELALSEDVAFRADFSGPLPPPAQRYWRGPVFEFTDGRRWWGATDATPQATPLSLQMQGHAYRYVLTLEPSGSRWLPALEMVTTPPPGVMRLPTLELKTQRPVETLRRDEFVSITEYRVVSEHPGTLTRNQYLPPTLSPRVRQLAHTWRAAARSEQAVVDAALRYFNTMPFIYTLAPPVLGRDPVDEFLFVSRRGFCEHYASAFTLLMRAAGIPARVVTGYQGGEVNPVGGYLIVRQADAHAWSEVWLPGAGWVRVDPTAAVAPERIEYPIDLGLARHGDTVRYQFPTDGTLAETARRARFMLDALNNGWNQWVLSYGSERQHDLLATVFSQLGLQAVNVRTLMWALVFAVAATLGVLTGLLLRRPRVQTDATAVLYERFQHKLRRHGFVVRAQEGPRTLLHRIEESLPSAALEARHIIGLYIALRYANAADADSLPALRRAVHAFKP